MQEEREHRDGGQQATMALTYPDDINDTLPADAVAERELATLRMLAARLPNDVRIYHSVHWSHVTREGTHVGEVDFIVLGPSCSLVLIEQKDGPLLETPDGLHKQYADRAKSVRVQMARTSDHLRAKLGKRFGRQPVHIESLLYCPSHRVRALATAGIEPEGIIDARRRDELPERVAALLSAGGSRSGMAGNDALHAALHQFLMDELDIVPDVSLAIGRRSVAYTRLSGGLAQWARQLQFTPFRLRVLGTAGSGKTQLALSVYRDAIAAGRRPLYLCFNRPLADHIRGIAPVGGTVANYHQFGDQCARAGGEVPDFTRKDIYDWLEQVLARATPSAADAYDVLIVDEGQDFQPAWATHLLRWLRPDGQAWWLEDPLQNLYRREPAALDGWVTLHADTNFRSPGLVVQLLETLLPLPRSISSGTHFRGAMPDIRTWHSESELVQLTAAALRDAVAAGFAPPDIAVVTYRGRERSLLMHYTELGGHTLRTPAGTYSADGEPLYLDGEVTLDTVHRFKGRSAACVIFTEIDFEELDDDAVRRLFVGATRATTHLTLLLSARADAALQARLHALAGATAT